MTPSEVNTKLIEEVRSRQERFTLGGCGIRLASDYVRGVLAAAGTDGLVAFPDAPSLLKDAETRLVYRNEDMAYEPPMTSMPAIETYCKSIGVPIPPRTLMVNELIVTSTREDRDGDKLFADGAIVDPKMPGLWHHMLPAIVGKMLAMRKQDASHVRIAGAVMDSPLGLDVANLVDFGALRISHGFRPLQFTPRDKGIHGGARGFDIKSFEVLEFSYVSVPSNPDAEIIAWSRGKVHTPVVKSWCRSLYEQREKVYPAGVAKAADETPQAGFEVIQSAGASTPAQEDGERTQGVELSPESIRAFVQTLTVGDLVAVEEKTEADVAQDSQAVYRGWNGRVVSVDEAGAAVEKTDGSPARIETSGRYRALTRQPPPKSEESAMDMLHVETQPKSKECIRWNKSLSPVFDVSTAPLEPSTTLFDWAAKYIELPVKELAVLSTSVPSARMGSFLTGLRNTLSQFKQDDLRNMSGRGTESPPRYEVIQLNSKLSDSFLVDGTAFLRGPQGKLLISYEPQYFGLSLQWCCAASKRDETQKLIDAAWKWAKENNFMKGEAFALSGEFLPATSDSWDGIFLDPKNASTLSKTLNRLNKQQTAFPNRGTMLMGPPGTGKTLSGRVLRNTANATFIWVAARDFHCAGSVGGMTFAFEMAKELAPSIIFFEDIDNWLDGYSVDILKSEMDGISRSSGVWTILTTNFPERMPEALIDRPGRFHDVLKIDLPDKAARTAMLAKWLPGLADHEKANTVAATDGYSGAHIFELCYFAKTLALEEQQPVEMAVKQALQKIKEQRQLITETQLAGSNYQPHTQLRRSKSHSQAIAPTESQIALGQDAARQAAEGHNPPNWAVDEELWERAKTAAKKTYDEGDEAFWPVVVTIYQNMGGTIQGKSEKGGPGSGNFGHGGRPGEVGGSTSGDGGGSATASDSSRSSGKQNTKPKSAANRAEEHAKDSSKIANNPKTSSPEAHRTAARANLQAIHEFASLGRSALRNGYPEVAKGFEEKMREHFRIMKGHAEKGGLKVVRKADVTKASATATQASKDAEKHASQAPKSEQNSEDGKRAKESASKAERGGPEAKQHHEAAGKYHDKAASYHEQKANDTKNPAAATYHTLAGGYHRAAGLFHSVASWFHGVFTSSEKLYDTNKTEACHQEREWSAWESEHTKQPAQPEEKAMQTKADAETKPDEPEGEGPTMTCPECGYEGEPNEEGNCPKCGAKMMAEKVAETKAGRVLSSANEAALRTALDSLRTILEQIEPPADPGTPKPVPEPATPDTNVMAPAAPETTANKPTPVETTKPDGSTNLQAACQTILRRLFDPLDAAEVAMLGKLSDAIASKNKSIDRAKRQSALKKFFQKR